MWGRWRRGFSFIPELGMPTAQVQVPNRRLGVSPAFKEKLTSKSTDGPGWLGQSRSDLENEFPKSFSSALNWITSHLTHSLIKPVSLYL